MRPEEAASLNLRLMALPVFRAWPGALADYRSSEGHDAFDIGDLGVAAYDACAGRDTGRRDLVRDIQHVIIRSLKMVDYVLDREFENGEQTPGDAANLGYLGPLAAMDLLSTNRALLSEDRIGANLTRTLALVCRAQGQSVGITRAQESYWHLVSNTTGALFRFGLWLGAVAANRQYSLESLEELARQSAFILQISDDLSDAIDAMEPADWSLRSLNIAILYAESVDHPGRDEFRQLLTRFESDPDCHDRLRELLFESNAVGYCAYAMATAYSAALDQIAALDFPNPDCLIAALRRLIEPCLSLMSAVGFEDFDAVLREVSDSDRSG